MHYTGIVCFHVIPSDPHFLASVFLSKVAD